jgi:hypothetical protein
LRADKSFTDDFDQTIGLKMTADRLFHFDRATERQIDFEPK